MRDKIKKIPFAKFIYFYPIYIKNIIQCWQKKKYIKKNNPLEFNLLNSVRDHVKEIYNKPQLNLVNKDQYYSGKNILGYPALSYIHKDDQPIGWSGTTIDRNGKSLPFLQIKPDIVTNFPLIFETYKPEFIVDFGTASGGFAIFSFEAASKYCTPKVLTIDISPNDVNDANEFHKAYGSQEKIKFIAGKSSLDYLDEVKQFISQAKESQRILFSFDNDHTYEHTYKELTQFAPLLRSGDVILMQDTWDQDLYGHETSPMLAVERFLSENNDFALDVDLLKKMELPCNFIYGVLLKK